MNASDSHHLPPTMAQPARYRIRVRGHLDASAVRRLRDMSVENAMDEHGSPIAVLRGELPDQAALIGILNTLNAYHLPLLSAEFLTEGEVS